MKALIVFALASLALSAGAQTASPKEKENKEEHPTFTMKPDPLTWKGQEVYTGPFSPPIKPDPPRWAFDDEKGVVFVHCVDHMIATRTVFIVRYFAKANGDVLLLYPSQQAVMNSCGDLIIQNALNSCRAATNDDMSVTYVNPASRSESVWGGHCRRDAYTLIYDKLLKAWGKGPYYAGHIPVYGGPLAPPGWEGEIP